MDIKKQRDERKTLAFALLGLFGLTFASVLLTILMFFRNVSLEEQIQKNEKIIIQPMVNSEQGFSFYGERGDARYLRLMALSFLSLRLDVSAQNVEQSHEILLSYSSEEFRAKLIEALSKEKKSLTVDNGASAFYVKDLRVSPSNGIVDVKGELKFSYGIRTIPTVQKHYQLKIDTRNGKLRLTDFVEISE